MKLISKMNYRKYVQIKIECFKHTEMLEIYERKYKQEYQLIGYSHDSIKRIGILVLYSWKEKTNEK